VALNFLVGLGAESAVSRERVITSVSAVPVGGSPTPATQTQTSTETRIETQRINFQDSVPLLRGLQTIGDERTNSVTLVGSPRQVDIATTQLTQLDARRRQVAVNVKIVDVNLLAAQDFNTSFSFGIGNNFFNVNQGQAAVNVGGVNPPTNTQVTSSTLSPPVTGSPLPQGVTAQPFLTINPNANGGNGAITGATPPFGTAGNPLQPGVTAFTTGSTSIANVGGSAVVTTTLPTATFGLPTLFQYPTRFLSLLQAQVTSQNAKILTDPTLIVQEGQQANVNLTSQVVGNVSTQTNFTAGAAIQTVNVTKEQIGLTLSIRIERIDDNGFIALSVAPVVRAPASSQTINLGGGNTQTIVLINERSLNSGLIRLRDSQTLILSGIIQDSDQTTVTKVPILGDIPILGALFRSTNKSHGRQEVIVLLTPQIIDDSMRASYGYNYTPGPEVRQILENRGLEVPRRRKK
jgi:type IV pilus assembly protein PilQ